MKDLAACTSGGQLRFRPDSRRIVLSVKTIGNKPAPTMAEKLRPVLLKLLKKYELIDK